MSRWRDASAQQSGTPGMAGGPQPVFGGRDMIRSQLLIRGALLLSVTLPLASCGDHGANGPEVKSVRTLVADPKPLEDDRRAVGEVRPRYESELAFLVSGKV